MIRAGRSTATLRFIPQRTPSLIAMLSLALLLTIVFALIVVSPWDRAAAEDQSSVAAGIENADSVGQAYAENAEPAAFSAERLVLVQSETWDVNSKRNIDDALALLPSDVRSGLGNAALGPVFILVNSDGMTLSGRQPYGKAANFYSTNEGRNEVVLYPGQSPRTALHELGHAYNLRNVSPGAYAHVFLDAEMQSFMSAAGWRVTTSADTLSGLRDHTQVEVAYAGTPIWTQLSRNDPLEDFANTFALYFVAPEELKTLSPARYTWFESRFGE